MSGGSTGGHAGQRGRGLEEQAGAAGTQIRAGCEGAERKAWSSLEGGKRGLEQPVRSMRDQLSLGQQWLRAASTH